VLKNSKQFYQALSMAEDLIMIICVFIIHMYAILIYSIRISLILKKQDRQERLLLVYAS
jgi:ABC-type lipoprotein release transport system permease subunit